MRHTFAGILGGFEQARAASPFIITDEHLRQATGNKALVIVWMQPYEFLQLTNDELETARGKAGGYEPLPVADYNEFARSGKNIIMPSLDIELDGEGSGRVVSHEGRHRALAVMKEYPTARYPVALFLRPLSRSTTLQELPRILWPQRNLKYNTGFVLLGRDHFKDAWMVQEGRPVQVKFDRAADRVTFAGLSGGVTEAGRVVQAGGRWFFLTEAFGQTFRWEFEPSLHYPPRVGPASWGGGFGRDGLSSVFQNGKVVGWWRNDKPALGALPKKGTIPVSSVDYALRKLAPQVKKCGITRGLLREGMSIEREHQDVTRGGVERTARIAVAHLCERKDYYKRLKRYVE